MIETIRTLRQCSVVLGSFSRALLWPLSSTAKSRTMASVKNMSAQVDKYIWVLSIICCLNQALWVNGEPIPLVGVETCAARDGCSQNCPTNHTCCACARCTDDGFPFARSFCFCCPPDHLCCAQTHRGSNPTCCPSGTMCGESNGVSMCITPFTPETRQADWTKLIPTYCTSDSETSSTNDDDLTTPSRDVTMETSITEHSSEGTDSTVLGTENPPLNSEPHESTADRDDSEGTTKRTTTESDNSESPTNLSDSSHVPEITTGSEIDLRTTNPDVDQSSLNPSVTSELISNSQESHTQTSSDGSTTDNLEEKNTTVITEITSDKADEPTSTQEPNSSNTSEAFDTRTVSDKTKTDEEPGSSVTTVTGIEESKTSESMINGTTSGRPE